MTMKTHALFLCLICAGLLGGLVLTVSAGPVRPSAEARWQPVLAGLYGDKVAALAFIGEPSAPSRSMLLLPEGGGLNRYNAEAGKWEAVAANPERPAAVVRSLRALPGDSQGLVAYAGLEGRTLFARTQNAGYDWQALTGPAGPRRLDLLAVTKSGTIYAAEAGANSLFVSADKGDTWAPKAGPPQGAGMKAVLAAPDESVVYALANGRLYRLEPSPESWKEVLGPARTPAMQVTVVAAGPRGRLYAAGTVAGIWTVVASEDRGTSWPSSGWPLDTVSEPRALEASESSTGIPQIHLGLADGQVFLSTGGAAAWQVLDRIPIAVTTLAYDPVTSDVWAGSGGLGLFRVGLNPLQTGAVPLDTFAILAPDYAFDGRLLALARVLPERREGATVLPAVQGLFESSGGDQWARRYLTDVLGTNLLASPRYATDQRLYSGQRLSHTGGSTWFKLGSLPGQAPPYVLSVGPITGTLPVVYGLQVPYIDGNGGAGLVLSEDGGDNWTATDVSVDHIVDLVVSPTYSIDRRAWFITESGAVYRTMDGTSFTQIGQVPAGARQRIAYDLAMSPAFVSDSTLFAAVEDPASPQQARVFVSTNAGVGVWRDRSRGLPAKARPRQLVFSPGFRDDGVIFMGTQRKAGDSDLPSFYSTDTAGEDWFGEDILPPSIVSAFAWLGTLDNGRLFAATGTAGVWVRELDGPPLAVPTASPTPSVTATGIAASETPTATASATPSATDLTPTNTPDISNPSPTATDTPVATISPSPTASPSSTATLVPDTATPTWTPESLGSTIYLPFTQKPRPGSSRNRASSPSSPSR
jgi:hypothetical protein